MNWQFIEGGPGGNCIIDERGTPIADRIDDKKIGTLMAFAPDLLAFAERSITDDCNCPRCEGGRKLIKQIKGENNGPQHSR